MKPDLFDALKYGVTGLGLALALLSYRLLRKEQTRKVPKQADQTQKDQEGHESPQERPYMVSGIKTFMAFSVVMCAIGLISDVFLPRSCADAVASLNRSNELLADLERMQTRSLAALQDKAVNLLEEVKDQKSAHVNEYAGHIEIANILFDRAGGPSTEILNRIGTAIDDINRAKLVCAPSLGHRDDAK